MYRNATDFCILILYPATLPNSLRSSSSFLVLSLGFSILKSCHLQSVTFDSSFPIWILFASFSFLITWLGLPKLYWIKVAKVGILVLFLFLEEMLSVFIVAYDAGCDFVIHSLYYIEACSLYGHFMECFFFLLVINGCWFHTNIF